MRNCKRIKVLAIIKELNGIDSGFILINLKINVRFSTILKTTFPVQENVNVVLLEMTTSIVVTWGRLTK
jgi:hypothetical protein